MDILTEAQLHERAVNKIYAKQFFAFNELEKIQLEIEGVIPSKIGTDTLTKSYQAQSNEIRVLKYIMDKLNINN